MILYNLSLSCVAYGSISNQVRLLSIFRQTQILLQTHEYQKMFHIYNTKHILYTSTTTYFTVNSITQVVRIGSVT